MSPTVSPPNTPGCEDDGQRSAGALAPVAFGQFLAAARCRSGLSIEHVSATTKIAARHLEALENGAIDQLPGGVYRRAWVRSYAAAVGLPPDEAIEQFDRMLAPPPAPAERRPTALPPALESSPPAAERGAAYRYRLLQWVLPAAVLVAGASVIPFPRSEPAPRGLQRTDIVLVPDEIPAAPMPDPRLVITSRPSGAHVTVNGIGWGMTPITIRHLPPGPKRIRATKDGYIGREASVDLGAAGSSATVRLILNRRE